MHGGNALALRKILGHAKVSMTEKRVGDEPALFALRALPRNSLIRLRGRHGRVRDTDVFGRQGRMRKHRDSCVV